MRPLTSFLGTGVVLLMLLADTACTSVQHKLQDVEWEKDPLRGLAESKPKLEKKELPVETRALAAMQMMVYRARLPETKEADLVTEWKGIVKSFTPLPGEVEPGDLDRAAFTLPRSLMSMGYHDAGERMLAALASGKMVALDDKYKEQLKTIRKALSEARAVAPIQARVREYLQKNPWPDADKVERGDHVDDYYDCQETMMGYKRDFPLRFRYALRVLTHYGPQPGYDARLRDALEYAEEWLEAKNKPTPPPGLEALMDFLVQAWADTPRRFARDEAAIFQGKMINRRAGTAAAVAHYRTIAANPKAHETDRFNALSDASWMVFETKDYPGTLEAWKLIQGMENKMLARPYALDAAYLALIIKDYKEVWRTLDLVADSDFEDMNDIHSHSQVLHKDIKTLVKDRAAAEAWWKASEAWWPEWQALARAIGLKSLKLQQEFRPWTDWDYIVENADTQLDNSKKYGVNCAIAYAELLQRTMVIARWHRAHAGVSVKVLREHVAKRHPKHAEAALALAARIEKEAEKR